MPAELIDGYNTLNIFKQPTDERLIDNTLSIGGTWEIGGVEVTATAEQLNEAGSDVGNPNLELGDASGVPGSLTIFPDATDKGKLTLTTSANVGNTTTAINIAPQNATRNFIVPNVNSDASFAMLNTVPATPILSQVNEIDLQCDVDAQTETIAAPGALAANKRYSNLALSGAGAVTLAAPAVVMNGMVKKIEMTVSNGAVTLALTNIQGGSAVTTATFSNVGDALILVGGTSKWTVIGEGGVVLT